MAALAAAAACAVGLLTTALATCRVALPLAATMMGCSEEAAAGRCGERCDEERCGERDDWSSGEARRTPLMVIGWGAFAGSAAALEMSELAACVIT